MNDPKPKRAFQSLALATLAKCDAILQDRATQYAADQKDGWDLQQFQAPFYEMTVEHIKKSQAPEVVCQRAIQAACLCDVKLGRMKGGYKEDTLVDLLSYTAALNSVLHEIGGGQDS
jgi:hypothetical protein